MAWDNAAAFDAFLATDLFKKYQATIGNMIARNTDLLVGGDELQRELIRTSR